MKTLNKVLNEGRKERETQFGFSPNPVVKCKDGYQVSIQCSKGTYCTPRQDYANVDSYTAFELGFPNEHDDLIEGYAKEQNNQTDTVFAYVPSKVVEDLLEKHGGAV